jgi:hypothetical protein
MKALNMSSGLAVLLASLVYGNVIARHVMTEQVRTAPFNVGLWVVVSPLICVGTLSLAGGYLLVKRAL